MNTPITHKGSFFTRFAVIQLGWDNLLLTAYASSISPIRRGLALAASLRKELAVRVPGVSAGPSSDPYRVASFSRPALGTSVEYFVNPLTRAGPSIWRQHNTGRTLTRLELFERVELDSRGFEFFGILRGWAVLHEFTIVDTTLGFQARRGSALLHLELRGSGYVAHVTLGQLHYENPRLVILCNLGPDSLKVDKFVGVGAGDDGWAVPGFMLDRNVPDRKLKPAEQVIQLLRLMLRVPKIK